MKKIITFFGFLLIRSLGAITLPNIEPDNRAVPPQIYVLSMANSQTPAPVVNNIRADELDQQAQSLMPTAADLALNSGQSIDEYLARRYAGSPLPENQ